MITPQQEGLLIRESDGCGVLRRRGRCAGFFGKKNVASSEAAAGGKTAREGAGLRRSVADVFA